MKSFSCFLHPLTKYLVYRHRDIVGLLLITINIVAGYELNVQRFVLRHWEVPGL